MKHLSSPDVKCAVQIGLSLRSAAVSSLRRRGTGLMRTHRGEYVRYEIGHYGSVAIHQLCPQTLYKATSKFSVRTLSPYSQAYPTSTSVSSMLQQTRNDHWQFSPAHTALRAARSSANRARQYQHIFRP